MQRFIPFEDEWGMLEALSLDALIPYQVGLPVGQAIAAQPTATEVPAVVSMSSSRIPVREAARAGNAST